MKAFFPWLGKALSEDNGNPSSIRIIVFFAGVQWSTAVTVGIIVTIFWYRELWLAVLSLILTGIFTLLGVKAYQKNKEQNVESK